MAKRNKEKFIVYGSGRPLRQFIYSEDLAKLILWVLMEYNELDSIILSPKEEISIRDVANMISEIFEYDNIIFDTSKSDGQIKKTVSNEKLIQNSKMIVTIAGTTCIDALFYEKPSVVLTKINCSSLSCIFIPENLSELPSLIKKCLNSKSIKYLIILVTILLISITFLQVTLQLILIIITYLRIYQL